MAASSEISDLMSQLQGADPDVREVAEAFAALDAVYRQALYASGAVPERADAVANSAEVTLAFEHSHYHA